MQQRHSKLMQQGVKPGPLEYLSTLINRHKEVITVILDYTEYPLAIDNTSSVLTIINPADLPTEAAVNYSMASKL